MNLATILGSFLLLAIVLLAVLAEPVRRILRSAKLLIIGLLLALQMSFTRRYRTVNAESSVGTHCVLNLLADAAHSYTHLLIKAGTDSDHGAVCGAANYPIGLTTDAPAAAEDVFNVEPLGVGTGTRKVRVATALGANIDLYTAANGFAQAEPGVAGTYYRIGRSIKAAVQVGSGDYVIEFAPAQPLPLVVLALPGNVDNEIGALTISAAYSQAEVQALRAKCEELADDFRALAVGLATPSLVKFLAA